VKTCPLCCEAVIKIRRRQGIAPLVSRLLFAPLKEPTSWWKVILWWEFRRIPYNLIVGVVGGIATSFYVFTFVKHIGPEVDVDFLSMYFMVGVAGIAANVAYTFGWLLEVLFLRMPESRGIYRSHTAFKYGLLLSVLLVSLPIVGSLMIWAI
jgi:hypothetical protein